MKAAYYESNGSAASVLKVGDVPKPAPGPGEVLVRVHSSGVNPSDVKTRAGLTRKMAFPRVIPHSDGAGVVDAVGAGVANSRMGQRVWLYNAQWGRPFGTAAEYVALPSEMAIVLPNNVSFADAANLGIPAQTAHAAVFANGPVVKRTLLVQGGAGAVGHYAVQLAKWGGATVITTVSSDAKATHARTAGADHVVNYRTENVVERVRALTGGAGVDHIVEVEFGENLAGDIELLKPHGCIVVYGSAKVSEPAVPVPPLMLKCATVKYIIVYNLSVSQRETAIREIDHQLRNNHLRHSIARRFPLVEIVAAHEAQESQQLIGNIVIDIA